MYNDAKFKVSSKHVIYFDQIFFGIHYHEITFERKLLDQNTRQVLLTVVVKNKIMCDFLKE